jgi:three-Cys-motif partner protein
LLGLSTGGVGKLGAPSVVRIRRTATLVLLAGGLTRTRTSHARSATVFTTAAQSGQVQTETLPAFALLDQRTFECRWSTVQALASHKKSGTKIELFYFLAAGWIDRALAALRDASIGEAWWGPDWQRFKGMHAELRRETFVRRFRDELGYKSAKAWPIYERRGGSGHVMYHMIHATDHPDAPALMARAYRKVGLPIESAEQLAMEWGLPNVTKL